MIWCFGFAVSYLMDHIDNQLPCWPTHILWKACREMVWGMQIWWGSGTRRFWHTCFRGLENRNTDINLSTCRVCPIEYEHAYLPFVLLCWYLTHWGRVTHICVVELTIIGSDNGLSPGRRRVIIWTNAGILLIGHLGTNVSDILIGI